MMKGSFLGLGLAVVLGVGPCTAARQTPSTPGAFEGEGVVHQGVGPECPNVWRITTTDGRMLWPVEDADFHVEGLRVRFTARERNNTATTCMAGALVEMISIQRL